MHKTESVAITNQLPTNKKKRGLGQEKKKKKAQFKKVNKRLNIQHDAVSNVCRNTVSQEPAHITRKIT